MMGVPYVEAEYTVSYIAGGKVGELKESFCPSNFEFEGYYDAVGNVTVASWTNAEGSKVLSFDSSSNHYRVDHNGIAVPRNKLEIISEISTEPCTHSAHNGND